MNDAIRREKQLKEWQRAWKVRLIQTINPEWTNLFDPNTGEINEIAIGRSFSVARAAPCVGPGLRRDDVRES